MQIRVQIRGRNTAIDISLESTVVKLKEKINEKQGIPIDQIILSFNSQVMQDDQTLSSCGVVTESLIISQTVLEAYNFQQYENLKLKEKIQNDKIEIETQFNSREMVHDKKFRQLESEKVDLSTDLKKIQGILNQRETELSEIQIQIDNDSRTQSKAQKDKLDEIKELNQNFQNVSDENNRLQNNQTQLDQQLLDQNDKYREMESENIDLLAQLKQNKGILNQRENEALDMQNQIDEKSQSFSNAQSIYTTNTLIGDQQYELDGLQAKILNDTIVQKQIISDLNHKYGQLQSENDDTKDRFEQVQRVMKEKENEIAQSQSQSENSLQQINELKDKIKADGNEMQGLQALVANLNQSLLDHSSKYRKLESENDNTLTEFIQNKKILNQRESEIVQLESRNSEQIRRQKYENEDTLDQLDISQKALSKKKNENAKLQEQIVEMQQTFSKVKKALMEDITKMEEKLQNDSENIIQLKSRVSEQDFKYFQLKSQNDETLEDYLICQRELSKKKNENVELQEQIDQNQLTLSRVQRSLLEENTKMKEKAQEQDRKYEVTKQDIQIAKQIQLDENNQLKERIQNELNKNERLQALVNKLNQSAKDLEIKNIENEDLLEELKDCKKQLKLQKAEIQDIQRLNHQNQIGQRTNGQITMETQSQQEFLFQQKLDKLTEDIINREIQQSPQKFEELERVREELLEKKYEVIDLQRNLKHIESTSSTQEKNLKEELEKLQQKLKKIGEKLQASEELNRQYEIENLENQYKFSNTEKLKSQYDSFEQSSRQQERQNDLLQSEKRQLTSDLQNAKLGVKYQQIKQLDAISNGNERNLLKEIDDQKVTIQNLTNDLQVKEIAYGDSQNKLSKSNKLSFESGKKLKELEESITSMKNLIQKNDKQLKDLVRKNNSLQDDLEQSLKQQEFYKGQIQNLKQQFGKQGSGAFDQVEKQQQAEQDRIQKEKIKKKYEIDEQEKNQLRMDEGIKKIQSDQDRMSNLLNQKQEDRLVQAKLLKKKMMESHGIIEVCFLVDVTGSMDRYKEQAMNCIDQSMSAIKEKTNRDVLWAAVAYQDFDELKQLRGLYKQIDFQADGKKVKSFLKGIKCEGGDDAPEDIRGGMKQMVKKLTWSKNFKIAMLICDAPTHGKKYNGGVHDNHPDQDIKDAIELLIENEILLVGILFNKKTSQMFEEIKEIYRENKREELLLYSSLEGASDGKIITDLIDLISQASQIATKTIFSGTRSKNQMQSEIPIQNQSQDGAMEALIKKGLNLKQFDKEPGIELVQTQFKVYRVEIKQQSFESYIENIEGLNIKRDFDVNKEGGQWNCIRTKKPVQIISQMKAVYLMKKQNSEEVYVVKMPLGEHTYKSLDDAIMECRSHLVSKCLMKKFINDLRVARDAKDPSIKFVEPQYSDFLILQESEESFWIAERYFDGAFVKYNNNFGFISEDDNQINHLAQAFSYYTFFVSNFNYMVCDVQGVGLYFTDPAVNTKKGTYDDTDYGVNGQSMFVVAYTGKKQQKLGKVFLDLLGIKME